VKDFDEKIKALDVQLRQIREQMKKAKGPAQNTLKQRAMKVLKQKKM
jgi:charged multivesicular body protein 5